jgi:hypothetical protein
MTMYLCPNCDAKIAPDVPSCPHCGALFGKHAAWRPLHPIEHRIPVRRSWAAWRVSAGMVALSLGFAAVVHRWPAMVPLLVMGVLFGGPGGYVIWAGLRVIRARDFTGWKIQDGIDPKKIKAAAYYFGGLFVVLGAWVAVSGVVIWRWPPWIKLWMASFALFHLAILVGSLLFARPRVPKSRRRQPPK